MRRIRNAIANPRVKSQMAQPVNPAANSNTSRTITGIQNKVLEVIQKRNYFSDSM
jgi:hypothetical protein